MSSFGVSFVLGWGGQCRLVWRGNSLAARGGVPALSCPLAPVALALLFAVVKKGDAYLFLPPRRVQWWGSLVEQPLPANSLTRNSRNSNSFTQNVRLVQREQPNPGRGPHHRPVVVVKAQG